MLSASVHAITLSWVSLMLILQLMKSSQSNMYNFKMIQLIILLLPIMVTCDVFSVDRTTNRIVNYIET